MSDIEEQHMEQLSYEEGEKLGEDKHTDTVLEDDLRSSQHSEVEGRVDRYLTHTDGGDSIEDDDEVETIGYKYKYQGSDEHAGSAPEENTNERSFKQSFEEEPLEQARNEDFAEKQSDFGSPVREEKDVEEPLAMSPQRVPDIIEDHLESNGNEENTHFDKHDKETNGNIQVNDVPVAKLKIDDVEMPTKGKVSNLKSLFESNAVHNSEASKHPTYKTDYGVGKSGGMVNKGVFQ